MGRFPEQGRVMTVLERVGFHASCYSICCDYTVLSRVFLDFSGVFCPQSYSIISLHIQRVKEWFYSYMGVSVMNRFENG